MAKRSLENMIIRPAVPDDAGNIAKMIKELAAYEQAPEECHATKTLVMKQLFGSNPKAEVIIAEADGTPLGFALFFHNFSTWECAPGLYLEDLFVRPACRRRGVGGALLKALGAIARERGCKRMEWAVLDWNQPAIEFYEALGAKAMRDWIPFRLTGEALAKLGEGTEVPTIPKAPEQTADDDAADLPAGVVVIHTDGGSQPNPGVGAWSAVLRSGKKVREISGGSLGTTNNRMELMAAISALEALKKRCKVELHTDSQYVKNGITTWIKGWKRKNWMRGSGRDLSPVKNVDLWKRLDALVNSHDVEWKWVKGHAGNEDNERCDELCTAEIERLKANSTKEQRKAALAEEARRQEIEQRGG